MRLNSYFLLKYANTTNMENMMITMMCTGNEEFLKWKVGRDD